MHVVIAKTTPSGRFEPHLLNLQQLSHTLLLNGSCRRHHSVTCNEYRIPGNFHIAKFLRILRIEAQSQKFLSQKFTYAIMVGAVIVGRGILLAYACMCLSDGPFKVL